MIDVSVGTGQAGKDVVTLECTKINGSGYRVLDSQIETNQITAGIGSTVAFVGSTGIVTYYPVNKSFGDELIDEGYLDNNPAVSSVNFINDPSFGFSGKNKYGLKIYSEPYDKDIGDTLVSEFIGICTAGLSEVISMEDIGIGNTFGVGQLITCDIPGVLFAGTKITGVTTAVFNLRKLRIPNITSKNTTVSLISIDTPCGAGVSACLLYTSDAADD